MKQRERFLLFVNNSTANSLDPFVYLSCNLKKSLANTGVGVLFMSIKQNREWKNLIL